MRTRAMQRMQKKEEGNRRKNEKNGLKMAEQQKEMIKKEDKIAQLKIDREVKKSNR